MFITQFPLASPKIVAIATELSLKPTYKFTDPDFGIQPQFGEDFTSGMNGIAPNGEDVGSTEAELKPLIEPLLTYFAANDDSGMARRLFRKFLAKQSQVTLWTDSDLDKAAAASDNFQDFCLRAWGAPYPYGIAPPPGRTRIHQALKAANWDISKLVAPTDLGTRPFNQGEKNSYWANLGTGGTTGDWANGLHLMINGVAYVYVIATHYYYDKAAYAIRLKYLAYDVFGLDSKDVDENGAKEKTTPSTRYGQAQFGITAWWQLQHQHAYAPLVTRFVVERDFYAPID